MKLRVVVFIFFSLFSIFEGFPGTYASDIAQRLQGKNTITYSVSFNGIPSGKVIWRYDGKRYLGGKTLDVVTVASETKILKLLNLESDEDIMLDGETMLPFRVERKVKIFGKQEFIQELYDQAKGIVTIIRTDTGRVDQVLRQKPPIHNILALLYFFPQAIALKERETISFNLPTQKIQVRVLGIKNLMTKGRGEVQAYLLSGSGARRFNLWLDVNDRLPLRLEFIVALGKITIERQYPPESRPSGK